jgi:hypothetical protein
MLTNGPYTHFHNSSWTLTSMCDFDLGCRDLNFVWHSASQWWTFMPSFMKSLYACRSFTPDKHFLMTFKCDLYLWPRDLVYAHETASYRSEHFYKVLLTSLYDCRRYALDKIWTFHHLQWPWPAIFYLIYKCNSCSHDNDYLNV